MVIPWL